MWVEIFIALLVILFLFSKIKGSKKNTTNFNSPRPMTEISEEMVAAKVVAPDFKKEIIEENPVTEVEPSSSQQATKKDAVNLQNNIQEIEAKIKIEIKRRQATPDIFPFLAVCCVLDLDPHSEDLANEFIAEVYTRLRLQGQLVCHGPHKVPEYSPVQIMLEKVMESAYEMLLYADDNVEIVRRYMPMLLSKQRSLSTRDQYGDEDLQPWVTFSSRFAVDKLKGVAPLKLFMEFFASNSQRSTVSAQGLADMFGFFTRVTLAFISSGADGKRETEITGEEYERKLQGEIEANFPTAHVTMTSATGDHGTDLIVDIKGIRIAIQAKYYKSTVGNAAVQEAFSGKGFYEADFAMVVCNSSFTRHAKELSEKINVILATTDNYIQLIKTITETSATQPMKD